MKLKFTKLFDDAQLPSRGSPGAAGLDLFAHVPVLIPPAATRTIATGVAVEIPPGHYGRIAPRSGLAMRAINVLAGVIDSDYRGELRVVLINHGTSEFNAELGMRIAQLIIYPIVTPTPVWAESLQSTERASGGFGSTGK